MRRPWKQPPSPTLSSRDLADIRGRLADIMIVLKAFDERLQLAAESQGDPENPDQEQRGKR